MSNPGVIKLSKKTIHKSKVWLDDNLGESIHIHIDDFRADLTVEEFDKLCNDVGLSINALLDVEGFDCNKIDPVYLEFMLWKKLMKLRSVKLDKAKLGDMLAPGKEGIYPLPESRAVRALEGDTRENDVPRSSHHIGQTSQERLDQMYNSVKDNGYPVNDQYIILYGDDNIIRDGQHRAACLYKQHGNIEVPVMRLYFDGYKPEKIARTRIKAYRVLNKQIASLQKIRSLESLLRALVNSRNTRISARHERKIERYIKKHQDEIDTLNKIFEQK